MPYADVRGVRYHYQVQGDGDPLVLLHGFTGSSESWRSQVPIFAQRLSTITVDLLGHGLTEVPLNPERYSMDNCAQDLAVLLGKVASEPVNLLGYSMGGRLALYLTIAQPALIKRLILESASSGLETATERQARIQRDEEIAQTMERDGIEAFVRWWEQLPLFASQKNLSASLRRELREQRLNNRVTGLTNSLRGMGTGAQPSLWSSLSRVKQPLLLLVGELDHKFLELGRRMASLAATARLEVVAGAGHTIHLEQPKRFVDLVITFLRDH